jgi:hypothetical protein
MAWVKIDDAFCDHPKVRSVGAIGQAIQVAAFCYCGRFLTDGFLSGSVAEAIIQSVIAPVTGLDETVAGSATSQRQGNGTVYTIGLNSGVICRDVGEFGWSAIMVNSGLWDEVDGGYVVHDYLDYNPSKDEILARKSQLHAAQKKAAASTNAKRWGTKPSRCTSDQSSDKNIIAESVAGNVAESVAPVPLPRKSNTHSLDSLRNESIINLEGSYAREIAHPVDMLITQNTEPSRAKAKEKKIQIPPEISMLAKRLISIAQINETQDRRDVAWDVYTAVKNGLEQKVHALIAEIEQGEHKNCKNITAIVRKRLRPTGKRP